MLDSLRPEVLGRAIELQNFSRSMINQPLGELESVRATKQSSARPNRAVQQALEVTGQTNSPRAGEGRGVLPGQTGAADQIPAGRISTSSAQLELSRVGQLISALFGQSSSSASLFATRQTPLLGASQLTNASVLASSLANQVSTSGMFYESHLLQLMRGQRQVAQLRREPQAQMPKSTTSNNATARSGGTSSAGSAGSGTSSTTSSDSAGNTANSQSVQTNSIAHHPQLGPLVRQQMEVLANGVFRWQGFIAEDVPMQWEVRERGGEGDGQSQDNSGDDESDQLTHSTSLRLDLPNLGAFEARLSLSGGGLQMEAWSDRDASLSQFNATASELRERLSAVGFDSVMLDFVTESEHSDDG